MDAKPICRLCCGDVKKAFKQKILCKYEVDYFECLKCGMVQTESPYWLDEAYSQAISMLDTGAMSRNGRLMRFTTLLLTALKLHEGVFLDYGGGHGVFTRMMRDHGFDFRWSDQHAENFYAKGFEYVEGQKVRGVTAFEVLEHLEKPGVFFDYVLGTLNPEIFIASTLTYAEPIKSDWHYLYPESGQHIAFFQGRTFCFVAEKYGYSYVNVGDIHILSTFNVSKVLLKLIHRFNRVIYPFVRFDSFVMDDHHRIVNRVRRQRTDKQKG